jgi:hypothetical protein
MLPSGQLQLPSLQLAPVGQLLPQAPQWSGSRVKSTQPLKQLDMPSLQLLVH